MKKLEFHPIANIFPLMEGAAFSEFKADAKQHGVREQIVIHEGKILDGRNRYRAACDLKIEFSVRKFDTSIDGDSPLAFVLSSNLHRRHLDVSQRALVAAGIANLSEGRPETTAPNGAVSQETAAETLGVSRRAVQRAAKVLEDGASAVVEAVQSGEVSVSDAAAIVDLPKAEQKKALAKVESGKAKTLREAAKKPAVDKPHPSGKQTKDPRAWESWESLFGQLKRATDKINNSGFSHSIHCRAVQQHLNNAESVVRQWKRDAR